MAVQFSISRRAAGDYSQVLVRFYSGKINQRAKTDIFVPSSAWDSAAGRCVISRRYETPTNALARKAQAELDTLAAHILQSFAANGGNVKPDWLQSVVSGTEEAKPLWSYIPAYCASRAVAPATRAKMQVLQHHLQAYARTHTEIYMDTLSHDTLDQLCAYFRTACDHSENSISCRLKQLRTLVYWIGRPTPNPFDGYTIPAAVYGTPIYLTKEERDYLYCFPDLTPAKAIQRDIFIFQCHTGCRVSDLYRLTTDNIRDGWLVYVPQKTTRERPVTIEVPLTATATEIVERYKGTDKRGRLLPFITEQQYNRAIRDIAHTARLDRPVMVLNPKTFETTPKPLWSVITTHTARKTFTQIAYAATGDKRLVAAMTGHAENSDAFNRYSEVTRDIKAKALAGIE